MDTINTGTIDKLANSTAPFSISNGFLLWTSIFIISLVIIILILTWLLVRREKALQLMAFSISPLGLKLSYELNQDEKLKSLAMDNIALQEEVKILKTALKNERWRSIGILLIFFVTFLVLFVFDKLKFKKPKKEDNVDEEQKTLE